MRFLSVAERELRAGARQKATYRTRWITAALFCGLLAWLMWAFKSFRAPQIFHAFSILIFFYCLILGTTRTADCLSSEKREGTMGLLFLTNLNGAEIIGGKLCSSALAAVYGLFAIFPLLALQMLIGGITLGQFWRTVLALVDAIFFSVAAGFLASSVCVKQFTAVAWGTGLALLWSAGLMGLAAAMRALRTTKSWNAWADGLSTFSPLYTLLSGQQAIVFRGNRFWWSLLAVTGISWLWLALATWRVSATWRDRPKGQGIKGMFRFVESWRQRGVAGRAALRRRLLAINPFYWLGGRNRISAPVFMVLTIVLAACTSFIAAPFFGRTLRAGTFSPMVGHLFAWLWAGLAMHALVLYYAAMVASRRLAEDKQTGALELVLSTPTSVRTISRGLWMAYARRMFFPALAAVLIHFFFILQGATMFLLDPPTFLPRGITAAELLWKLFLGQPLGGAQIEWGFILGLRVVLLILVLFIFAWLTLGFIGRWLGLRMKHPGFAPMVSLAVLFVPPVVTFSVACHLADEAGITNLTPRIFMPLLVWTAFGIMTAHCVLLSLWASGRLQTRFREVVTSRFQPPPTRRWWLPTRRGLVRFGVTGAIGAAAVVIIVVFYYGYQNWQSRRAWVAFQRQLKARGESLDAGQQVLARVPDEQNFALTPAFKKFVDFERTNNAGSLKNKLMAFVVPYSLGSGTSGFDWIRQASAPLHNYSSWFERKNRLPKNASRADFGESVLEGMAPQQVMLREASEAARLGYFQPSIESTASGKGHFEKNANTALEDLHILLQVRACALLATNRNAEAAEDVLTGLQLARLARQGSDSQTATRVQTMLVHSLQPIWEGIIQHRWNEPQLRSMQNELTQFNLLADYTNAVHRAVVTQIASWGKIPETKIARQQGRHSRTELSRSIEQLQPRAWWYDNCIQLYQAGQTAIAKVNVAGSRVNMEGDWDNLEGLKLENGLETLLQQYYWSGASPSLVSFAQTAVNQGIIACALERHRLAHSKYPETLEQLVPEYLTGIPKDVVRGLPMIYEPAEDGKFTLRSVGPNQKNDRNKPASDDWLWSFPTNAPPMKAK